MLGADVNFNSFVKFTDCFAANAANQTPQLLDEYYDAYAPLPTGMLGNNVFSNYSKPRKKVSSTPPTSQKRSFKFPNPDGTCPECGMKLVLRSGKYGPFYGCSGYGKMHCKYVCTEKQYNATITKATFKKKFEEPKQENKLAPLPPLPPLVKETKPEPEPQKQTRFSCDDCMLGFKIHPDTPMMCRFYDSKDHTGFCDMFTPKDREKRLKMLKAIS